MAGGHTCFNSQVYIDSNGALLGVHRKLQPTYVERVVWAQGGGYTLRTFDSSMGKVGGLACWEHTMNLARQALVSEGEQIHAAAWPALSTMAGFTDLADIQIDAMMKNHAITGQCFVISASNWIDDDCLQWMEKNIGKQDLVKGGGGWSSIIAPFCNYVAGPKVGKGDEFVTGTIDLTQIATVKIWVDSRGHYARPEVLQCKVDYKQIWPDEDKIVARTETPKRTPDSRLQDDVVKGDNI
ncbi:unnamed protein product [Didymodactylos carnosus]|uniref:CN hydrolase domain-containing protein n=1 Tax=Didymodactylos carnosus TaxID=1234261 RepID=A0A815MNU7_9BILA|nr:unnamed protein product [Didymodactylos carnosus]CAF1425823.1 unnamed protein product [Didymodactylos carnosus]CAF3968193.1 unnamed protein product [Didymodactylos carnosus]CAF4306535.1 unnamed protein product [Didymodactylos carnosus]